MKLFKTIDEKFADLGFVKKSEDKYGVTYDKEIYLHRELRDLTISEYDHTHRIFIGYKRNGNHIIQSFDPALFDVNNIGNCCCGLTEKEAKLSLKKMKEMRRKYGWYVKNRKDLY